MLDPRRLRIFVTVVDEGSFTAAAQRLFLTQSAVSQQMSALEREVGTALFRRGPRGVEPTSAGDVLARRSKGLFGELHSIEQEVRRFGSGRHELRLGAFASAGVELLPQTLRAFLQRRPDVHVEVSWAVLGDPLALLRDGNVHLMLMWDYDFDPLPVDPTFTQLHLQDDPLDVLLPAGHPLADVGKISLADLAGEKWIARTHRAPYAADSYERMLRMVGLEPAIVLRVEDYQSMQGLVAAGLGVSLAPRLSLVPHRADVVVRPTDGHVFARRITALMLPDAQHSDQVADLIETLRSAAGAAG